MTRAVDSTIRRALTFSALALLVAGAADAEPMFLAKQYARCTTCHYSPIGGGLLTPYGRSLSNRELSTTGDTSPAPPPGAESTTGEEAFLWGALGDRLGPLQLGGGIRPSHLGTSVLGATSTLDFFMNADFLAAYQVNGWTFYGEVGREPKFPGWKIDSYEYWVGRQTEKGFGFRAGRFLPAFGVRFADHTAFNRANLTFDKYDQVFGLEFSHTTERHLLQVTLSPGRADSIIHDDGRQAFSTTGRFQYDLTTRTALVLSGFFRDGSKLEARSGAVGGALGFAPFSHLTTWTEFDTGMREGVSNTYTIVNETSVEPIRGLWLKFSPQLRKLSQRLNTGQTRLLFEADFLPRTHFNADVSFYRDKDRSSGIVAHVVLVQLHLYL